MKSKAGKKVRVKVKVTPKFKKKRFVIQMKKGKKWVAYKKVKTNKKGVGRTTLRAVRGKNTYYRIVVPKNKNFAKTVGRPFYTYVIGG